MEAGAAAAGAASGESGRGRGGSRKVTDDAVRYVSSRARARLVSRCWVCFYGFEPEKSRKQETKTKLNGWGCLCGWQWERSDARAATSQRSSQCHGQCGSLQPTVHRARQNLSSPSFTS